MHPRWVGRSCWGGDAEDHSQDPPVDMLCGTMGDNCPEVAPFNGEDYFEAGKPIGCCYTPQQQAVWAKWNSLATRVAKCASPPAPTTPAQPSRPEAYAQSSVRGAPTHESTLRPAQGSTPQAPLTARPPRARARQARRHPRVPARDEGHDRSQVGVPPPPPFPCLSKDTRTAPHCLHPPSPKHLCSRSAGV